MQIIAKRHLPIVMWKLENRVILLLIIGYVMHFMAFWVLEWWVFMCKKRDVVRYYAVFGEVDGWVSYQKWQGF